MVTQCTAEALPLSSPGADVIRFDTDRTQDPDGRRPADPAVTAAAERNRRRLGYLATKRAFDILISSLALVVLSPLYAALAMAIRIDSPGPAIFSQERVGQDGRPFTMYKFRSMYQDAEERLADLRDRDSITFDEWVDLDLLYIKKCSVLTDLKLMVQTAGVMLTAQGE